MKMFGFKRIENFFDQISFLLKIFYADVSSLDRLTDQISLDPDIDHHTFIGFNHGSGVFGVGYQGSVCHENPR